MISVENCKFSPTRAFNAPLTWFPLELCISAGGKKNYNDGATRSNKKFDNIFSRADTIHQRDRRIDNRRQKRLHLRIALCGKNSTVRSTVHADHYSVTYRDTNNEINNIWFVCIFGDVMLIINCCPAAELLFAR